MVELYWFIDTVLWRKNKGGESRTAYGKVLLKKMAEQLTAEYGKGFDQSNLRYMRLFYQAFPIRDALRHEFSIPTWCD